MPILETCAPKSPPRRQRSWGPQSAENTQYFLPLILIPQLSSLQPFPGHSQTCQPPEGSHSLDSLWGRRRPETRRPMSGRREDRERSTGNFEFLFANSTGFQIWHHQRGDLGFSRTFPWFYRKGWRGWESSVGASGTNSQKALLHAQEELGLWMPGGARQGCTRPGQSKVGWWGGHGLEGGRGPQYPVQRGLGVGGPGGSPRRHSSLLGRVLSSPAPPPPPPPK